MSFEASLRAVLRECGADEDVYAPYIAAALAEQTPSARADVLELLGSALGDARAAAAACDRVLEAWSRQRPSSGAQLPRGPARPRPAAAAGAPHAAAEDRTAETPPPAAPAESAAVSEAAYSRPAVVAEKGAVEMAGDIACFERGDTLMTGHRLQLAIEDTLILDGTASLSITRGRRYGLIGPNGVGKTTLLRALHQVFTERCGPGAVHYVGQTDAEALALAKDSPLTLVEHVLTADARRAYLEGQSAALSSDPSPEAAERLCDVLAELEQLESHGTATGEQRARALLRQLGFADADARVALLSGGWRSRLEVARALWSDAEVLLLDEPTNHMDLEAVLQLAGLLRASSSPSQSSSQSPPQRTLVLVSHDAAFLDLVCTDTLCLHMGVLRQFDGPYGSFEEQMQQSRTFHEDIYAAREKKEQALRESVLLQRQRAAREGDGARARNAASREKKMDRICLFREDGKRFKTHSLKIMDASAVRLPLRPEPVRDGKGVNMKLPAWITPIDPDAPGSVSTASSESLLEATPLVVGPGWGKGGGALLRTPPLSVLAGDRIAVVGSNGCGKTTLLRALCGSLPSGAIAGGSVHAACSVAVVDQNQLAALDGDMSMTPIEWITRRMGASGRPRAEEEARKHLSCFALGPEAAGSCIASLSGGMRVRLLLAGVFVASPRVLFLDEPTNHLDGESIAAFAEFCRTFPGAIVGVSHHVAFLLQVFRDLWLLEDGRLRVRKTEGGVAFSQAFAEYAQPFVGAEHRAAFQDMLRIRAARSTIVAHKETSSSLYV
eukprot:m51a1_g4428 putative protein abcf-1 (782) ;mRNA; f:63145-65746